MRDITIKAKNIAPNKTKNGKSLSYESLTFVKSDSEKWVQSIEKLLRLIFEINMKYEIEERIKAILNWSAGIDEYEEEVKSSLFYTVPDKVYGKNFDLCKIPTQSLKKIEELEKRIQILNFGKNCYHLSKGKRFIKYQDRVDPMKNTLCYMLSHNETFEKL